METGTFKASDGAKLFYRKSGSQSPKRILIFHGLVEHSEYYPQAIQGIFPNEDVNWAMFDFRGHGKSEGRKNEVSIDRYRSDVFEFIHFLGWKEGSFGGLAHSFGGLLALFLLREKPRFFKALALSSPFLGFNESNSQFKINSIRWTASILPCIQVPNAVSFQDLTHDKNRVRQYQSDPLIKNHLSFGTLKTVWEMQQIVMKERHFSIPLLLLRGEGERVVSPIVMEKWYSHLNEGPHEQRVFPRLYHEILNELGNQQVFVAAHHFFSSNT